jgi:hypothetical protein
MLARSHRDFLTRDGYAVLSALVPDRLLKAARDVICSFVGADLDRPETWHRHEPLVWSVVPVHHAQAFWNVRQWPALHDTFAEIWGTEKLWVTMDRGIFKVPESESHPDHVDVSVLHWDLDLRAASATTYQGMLFLTDAASGEGSFEWGPSIFQDLDRYLHEHPGPVLDVPVDVAGHGVVEVPARAGDLGRSVAPSGRPEPWCPTASLTGGVDAPRGGGRRSPRTYRMLEAETRTSLVAWLEGADRPGARRTSGAHSARSPTRRN